jgi:hypothetical protein
MDPPREAVSPCAPPSSGGPPSPPASGQPEAVKVHSVGMPARGPQAAFQPPVPANSGNARVMVEKRREVGAGRGDDDLAVKPAGR